MATSFRPPFSNGQTGREPRLEQLAGEERWTEIVGEMERSPLRDSSSDYYYGIALAQLGRYDEARSVFAREERLHPKDKRFLVELGGIAFRQKNYPQAARWLERALAIDPRDSYASDFLATIYFLEGNLEAALKYWNRSDKPRLENVSTPAGLKIRPALVDRAFLFSPAGPLRLGDFLASKKRVSGLEVFPDSSFELAAEESGKYDLNFHARELNGFGPNRWAALVSVFRGVFYQTVYPDYFNVRGKALNVNSLLRWDADKRRLALSVSSPLRANPRYRWRLGVDLRDENWDIVPSFKGPAPLLGALELRTQAISGGVSSFNAGRWDWSLGGELSGREYRSVFRGTALPPSILLSGNQLKQTASLKRDLLRVPEKRFVTTAAISDELAGIWSSPRHTSQKVKGSLLARWFPRMKGEDYAIREEVRAGKTFGEVPFDELFMLGLERDNDLWLRAHIATRDGRKGSAPLGRNYFLSNWDITKNIYNHGIFGIALTPFLDTGKITDPVAGLGSNEWLWDTGAQANFTILGVGFTFNYGKDLRSGANAFYFLAGRQKQSLETGR
ncbi:MAG: tetratricopeptide repeat protein [Acidobacteria bacterium]|nr:tetratricopeptide repeat protein [Acidobacteriota bacterium]